MDENNNLAGPKSRQQESEGKPKAEHNNASLASSANKFHKFIGYYYI
jgi:hypothetical protein